MSRLGLRTPLLSLGVLSIVLGLAPAAAAHPLGNSSTNLHSGLTVESGRLVVDHVVDLAEIRTVQLIASADRDGDRRLDAGERSAHAAQACQQVADAVTLRVDGDEVEVRPTRSAMELAPGQGGLSVARLGCTLVAPLAIDGVTRIDYRDDSFAGRFGWREVTAVGNGTTLVSSDVPAESPSDRLRDYPPEEELRSVPDVRSASLQVRDGGRASAAGPAALGMPAGVLPRGVDAVTQRFAEFVSRQEMTLGFGVLAVLLAVVLGSGHALAPGHGKTVMAAYLVGQEGTRRQALLLGGVVTLTHTAGVLLLGLLLLVSTTLAPDRLLPLLEVASGALLAGVGVYLLRRALGRRRALAALQSHGVHDHGHDHDHGHGHGHDHGHHDHDHGHHDHDHGHGHDHQDHQDHQDHPDRDPVTAGGPAGAVALSAPSTALVATAPVPAARVVAVDHDHGFGRHTHVLPDPARPLGARSLAAMGVAGGLVPSPSALVVLLGATALGRAWFGVLLVLAYGVGMALTLTAAGLALLRARRLLDRVTTPGSSGAQRWFRGARVLAALPVLTAVVIVGVGLLLVTRGALSAAGVG